MTYSEYKQKKDEFLSLIPTLNLSEATGNAYKAVLEDFGAHLEQTEGAADAASLEVWRAEKRKTVKANTVNHYFVLLGRFFDWAGCEQNPAKELGKAKGEEIKLDLLTLDEIQILLDVKARTDTDKRNRAIMLLLMQTGIRNSELRNLSLEDLDFENGVIEVREGKGGKSRFVAFPVLAKQAVQAYLLSGVRPLDISAAEPLFGSCADEDGRRGRTAWHPFSRAHITALMKRYVEKHTGHSGIGSHDLRHAYASYASHRGVPTRLLSLSMGHASETTTSKIYISVLDKQRAAMVVNGAFDS